MAVLAEQGSSWRQHRDCRTAADSLMPPHCPAMALPSIDEVGHVEPYLLAAHRQLVVGDPADASDVSDGCR